METMLGILQNIISLMVGGIVGLAEGIGKGIVACVKYMFFEVVEGSITGLNPFGMIIIIFAGIALAIAITTKIYMLLASLGGKR